MHANAIVIIVTIIVIIVDIDIVKCSNSYKLIETQTNGETKMKAIIAGKTYNTKTAEQVAQGNNSGDGCFRRCEELYLTKKGNYFIIDANERFIGVNKDGTLRVDPSYTPIPTIKEWLEEWNVSELEEREMKVFGIEEG